MPPNKSVGQNGDETMDTIKAALFKDAGFIDDTVPLIEQDKNVYANKFQKAKKDNANISISP
jgi:hypothetical protein